MHQRNVSFREAVLLLGEQYQIEIIFENENVNNKNREKYEEIFQKSDLIQRKLTKAFDQSKHSKIYQSLKEVFLEIGFLEKIDLLTEWGLYSLLPRNIKESFSVPKEYQLNFYTLPIQTEKGEIFGFFFILFDENSGQELLEKYSFTVTFTDRYQPIINFPKARKNIKSREIVIATNFCEAFFLIKNKILNTILVSKNHLNDGLYSYLARYISKAYLLLPSHIKEVQKTNKLNIRIRWVPFQILERVKFFKNLNSEKLLDWLMTSEKIRPSIEKTYPTSQKETKHEDTFSKKFNIFSKTSKFYHHILLKDLNNDALIYLKNRGFDKEDIKNWQLGFCPKENILTNSLLKYNIDISDFLSLDLLRFSQKNNRYYDFFYNRIIIPILNHEGECVALGGRVFNDTNKKTPKYINSSESILFSKAKILFNFFKASNFIIKAGFAVVVEGFMDCIMLSKHGIQNTVAVMGTALTVDHLNALYNLTKRVILCFDSDHAGLTAIQKSFLANFEVPNLSLEVLNLPSEKDPDEFVKAHGIEKFNYLLQNNVVDLHEHVLNSIRLESHDNEEFLENLKSLFKNIVYQKGSLLLNNVIQKLEQNYEINWFKVFPKPAASEPTISVQIGGTRSPHWVVSSVLEIKILFSFFYLEVNNTPVKLKHVLLNTKEDDKGDRLFFKAYSQQLSEIGKNIMSEIFQHCLDKNYQFYCDIKEEDLSNFRKETAIFIAFLNKFASFLIREGLVYLLESHKELQSNNFDCRHFWQEKNLVFLNLQRKNALLGKKFNTLAHTIIELFTKLEISEIDSQLMLYSRGHFNDSIPKEFMNLMQARSERQALLIEA